MRAMDTSEEAARVQIEIWRRMGPEGRGAAAAQMSEDARELSRAGIRMRHPEYTAREVELALMRLLYGDALCDAAWPGSGHLVP